MKKLGAMTLGCRVNQYETQVCCEIFESFGYTTVEPEPDCDAYFLNTCSVTLESDRKSRQMIARLVKLARPNDAPVIVCGCHVQAHPGELFDYGNIRLCGNADKAAFVRDFLNSENTVDPLPQRSDMTGFYSGGVTDSKNTRAFVKIEDGCDNFCSYCIVPYLRGPVRSRPAEEVLSDVRALASKGFREIVLTGIETSFYGRDLGGGDDLASLSKNCSEVDGIERIRFGSLRPTLFTPEFTKRLADIPAVMPHFHLSVQSGSDSVLAMMRRDYTKGDVLRVFDTLRDNFPAAAFSSDIICGFPGETERDLEDSMDIVTKGELIHTHVFPYSERPGTAAASLKPSIPVSVRRRRAALLQAHADRIAKYAVQDRKGEETSVLIERIGSNHCFGHTASFVYCRFELREGDKVGDIVRVRLTGDYDLRANPLTAFADRICSLGN